MRLALIWICVSRSTKNSNMSKLDIKGKPIYNENGKVMKGPKLF